MPSPWDRLAVTRDARTGETGDLWHRGIIDPAVRALVGPVRGLRVLEIACGNGYLARSFARAGAALVVGIDSSSRSIRRARRRERALVTGARFEVGDASQLRFEPGAFDLVVANMALMDIRDARAAVAEVARVLRPSGRFVFSITHPCFDVENRSFWSVERWFDPDGAYRTTVYRKVHAYRAEGPSRTPWRVGPRRVVWTPSYHRTLTTYSGYLRRAGLVIVALEEPSPTAEVVRTSDQGPYMREIPLHLVVEAVRWRAPRPGSRTPARTRRAVARRSGSGARMPGSGSPRRGSRTGS